MAQRIVITSSPSKGFADAFTLAMPVLTFSFQRKNSSEAARECVYARMRIRVLLFIISFNLCFLLDDFFRRCNALVFNGLQTYYDIFAKRITTKSRKKGGNYDKFAGQLRQICENAGITTFLRFSWQNYSKNAFSDTLKPASGAFQNTQLRHFCDFQKSHYDKFAKMHIREHVFFAPYLSLNQRFNHAES